MSQSDDDLVKKFLAEKEAKVLPEGKAYGTPDPDKQRAKDLSDSLAYNYGTHFRKTYGRIK